MLASTRGRSLLALNGRFLTLTVEILERDGEQVGAMQCPQGLDGRFSRAVIVVRLRYAETSIVF
ncbi:MAG: hypothetical protein HND47_24575 [Chloroflexi bacterium]|nr:hypothetical protein [Chloroflexota bacterium]